MEPSGNSQALDHWARPYLVVFDRIFLGAAAASGVIVAGCLGGLPASPCAAIALTYSSTLQQFGAIGLVALNTFIITRQAESFTFWSNFRYTLAFFIEGAFLLAVCGMFYGSANASIVDIQKSTVFCYVGTDQEVAKRVHQAIALEDPIEALKWWKRL